MKGFTVTRKIRGAEYVITVKNPKGVEAGCNKTVILDGKEYWSDWGKAFRGVVIPYAKDGRHTVVVTLG